MSKRKTIFLVAGSSGGHILPALQLGKKWKKENPDGKIIFFCGSKSIDKKIILDFDFLYKTIKLNLDNFPGKKFYLYPKFLIQLFWVFFISFITFFKSRPSKIISTGGYLAIPVCLVARIFRVKVELFELNVVPGKAVKVLLPFADKVFVTFESTKLFLKKRIKNFSKTCFLQDYPLRFDSKEKRFNKEKLLAKISQNSEILSPNKKTIFLLGGSQGSVFLNKILKSWITKNKDILNNIQIIHQTGSSDKTDWIEFYKTLDVAAIVFDYNQNIKDYYLISDLIISRAGAGTLFELEFFKKRSLIIPLKSNYTDHQVDNAYEMSFKNPDLFYVQDQTEIKNDFSLFDNKLKELL